MTADVSLHTDASPDSGRLSDIAMEMMIAFRRRLNIEQAAGDGTGARNSGTYRVTQHNLQQARSEDAVTWLLSTRTYFSEVAVSENDAQLRRALVALGGEVMAWITDIDNRS